MLYPLDFEKRTVANVRRWTDDIEDCASAKIEIVWHGQAPVVRFAFGHPILCGRPTLGVALVVTSRSNPFAPGRLLQGEELRRLVRDRIEAYLKLNGIQIARKALQQYADL